MKLEIKKKDYFGRGISNINGKTIFIEKGLPGEIVNIEVIKDLSGLDRVVACKTTQVWYVW